MQVFNIFVLDFLSANKDVNKEANRDLFKEVRPIPLNVHHPSFPSRPQEGKDY